MTEKPSVLLVKLFQSILEIDSLKSKLTKELPLDSDQYKKINSRLIQRAVHVNELLVEFDSLFSDKTDSGQ